MSLAVHSTVTPTSSYSEEAAYGKLPFDRFVLDHWDYGRLVGGDQTQWDDLAKRLLSMSHIARSSYWEASRSLDNVPANDSRMPTQEQIHRVLAPHQTVSERDFATTINDCLRLRTCYEPSLTLAYAEMTRVDPMDSHDARRVLDNEMLYGNLGGDLTKLFLRMPQLADTVAYCGYPETEDLPLDSELPADGSMIPLYNAVMKERLVIYLLDKEALQKKMIKLIWFDLGGNCVWWNWITLSDTQDFEGHLFGLGHRLDFIFELSDGDPSLLEAGALIRLN